MHKVLGLGITCKASLFPSRLSSISHLWVVLHRGCGNINGEQPVHIMPVVRDLSLFREVRDWEGVPQQFHPFTPGVIGKGVPNALFQGSHCSLYLQYPSYNSNTTNDDNKIHMHISQN